MAKILILYASHFGQTRKIAQALRDDLVCDHDVDLVDAKLPTPPPDAYDAVVAGSCVEAGRHAADIRNYLAHHRLSLGTRWTAFFSVSMAAADNPAADPSGYLAALFEEIGWRPTRAIVFAGALPYRRYNWLLRLVMKRISKGAGHTTDTSRNHEFTDWRRVHELAREISRSLAPQQHGATPTG